jgi:short subunit dehydrogenase-like uncharacterized protein
MIYGASGYTGKLLAEEAVRQGHRPVLAGRSVSKLEPIARELGLEHVGIDLHQTAALKHALSQVALVLHAAGPFSNTSAPMVNACLQTGTHYCDITGEIAVFEQTFAKDNAARQRGIVLISGVGFDVVPTDSMARYVAEQVSRPTNLELAFAAITQASPGTTKTALEGMGGGGTVRRDGALVAHPVGAGVQNVRFIDRERSVTPIPWGDIATAYRTTGIPNITTYMAIDDSGARLLRWFSPLIRGALRSYAVRRIAQRLIERYVHGPDRQLRQTGRSYIWARATNEHGDVAEAWLETIEPYRFTAEAGVRSVERILYEQPRGALTPAQAFGADFVLSIPGTRRADRLI